MMDVQLIQLWIFKFIWSCQNLMQFIDRVVAVVSAGSSVQVRCK